MVFKRYVITIITFAKNTFLDVEFTEPMDTDNSTELNVEGAVGGAVGGQPSTPRERRSVDRMKEQIQR